jgi:formate dehydrogenase maturation protein FdhE
MLAVDLSVDAHAVPLVDELAALPLHLWAGEQGYGRMQRNLFLL